MRANYVKNQQKRTLHTACFKENQCWSDINVIVHLLVWSKKKHLSWQGLGQTTFSVEKGQAAKVDLAFNQNFDKQCNLGFTMLGFTAHHSAYHMA